MATPPARFVTTRWTLVLAARELHSPQAAAALTTLCETYWRPVYVFIRRTGRSDDDARDLTQAFFARVLEKNYFKDARQERGRFRTFLLTALRHFLSNERDAALAVKRGGRVRHVPIEPGAEDHVAPREPADHETPERLYERRWAHATLEAAMTRLGARYQDAARRRLFERIRPFLTADPPSTYADLSAELGVAEGTLRVAVHRLRQQFATALREMIAETVEKPADVDDELRYLLSVVAGR